MKIRYRWQGDPADAPMIGCYLMSGHRARGAYLILGVDNRGRRGGLGEPVYTLLVLTVDRVSCAEALANRPRLWEIKWDARRLRPNRPARR